LPPLKPLLPTAVTKDSVLSVLASDVIAEEAFADFLELLGQKTLFAYLNYWYLSEYTESELHERNVELVSHLRFRSP